MAQKKLLGQTAGGIIKTARLVKMCAGNTAVVVKDRYWREFVACIGDDGDLLLDNGYGMQILMPLSGKARNRLRELLFQADSMMLEKK